MDMGSFMQQFVQQLINGISLGSIYALVALGYTMIYGIITPTAWPWQPVWAWWCSPPASSSAAPSASA